MHGDYDKARVPATRPSGRRRRRPADRSAGAAAVQRERRARGRRPARRPRPMSRRPSRTASDGDALGLARRGLEVVAQRQPRGQRRGVRAARAVRGAVGVARARRSRRRARRRRATSTASLAVPAGDHDRPRAERVDGARQRLALERVVAGEHARLGEVRASRRSPARRRARRARAWASASSSRAPDSATITGSTTIGVPGRQQVEAPPPPPRALATLPSIPTLTASTPMSSTTARTCATIIAGDTASTRRHRDGVLRRDRRDRRRAVHAGAGEGLQVGLDPGAAAGVRAGDRQADGDAAGVGHGGEG